MDHFALNEKIQSSENNDFVEVIHFIAEYVERESTLPEDQKLLEAYLVARAERLLETQTSVADIIADLQTSHESFLAENSKPIIFEDMSELVEEFQKRVGSELELTDFTDEEVMYWMENTKIELDMLLKDFLFSIPVSVLVDTDMDLYDEIFDLPDNLLPTSVKKQIQSSLKKNPNKTWNNFFKKNKISDEDTRLIQNVLFRYFLFKGHLDSSGRVAINELMGKDEGFIYETVADDILYLDVESAVSKVSYANPLCENILNPDAKLYDFWNENPPTNNEELLKYIKKLPEGIQEILPPNSELVKIFTPAIWKEIYKSLKLDMNYISSDRITRIARNREIYNTETDDLSFEKAYKNQLQKQGIALFFESYDRSVLSFLYLLGAFNDSYNPEHYKKWLSSKNIKSVKPTIELQIEKETGRKFNRWFNDVFVYSDARDKEKLLKNAEKLTSEPKILFDELLQQVLRKDKDFYITIPAKFTRKWTESSIELVLEGNDSLKNLVLKKYNHSKDEMYIRLLAESLGFSFAPNKEKQLETKYFRLESDLSEQDVIELFMRKSSDYEMKNNLQRFLKNSKRPGWNIKGFKKLYQSSLTDEAKSFLPTLSELEPLLDKKFWSVFNNMKINSNVRGEKTSILFGILGLRQKKLTQQSVAVIAQRVENFRNDQAKNTDTKRRQRDSMHVMEKLRVRHLDKYVGFLEKRLSRSFTEWERDLIEKVFYKKMGSLKKPNVRPWLAETWNKLFDSYQDGVPLTEKQQGAWLWTVWVEIASEYILNVVTDEKLNFKDTPENRKRAAEMASLMHESLPDYIQNYLDINIWDVVHQDTYKKKMESLWHGWGIDLILRQKKNYKKLLEIEKLQVEKASIEEILDINQKLFRISDIQDVKQRLASRKEELLVLEKLEYPDDSEQIKKEKIIGIITSIEARLNRLATAQELAPLEKIKNKIEALQKQLLNEVGRAFPTFFKKILHSNVNDGHVKDLIKSRIDEAVPSIGQQDRIQNMTGSTWYWYYENVLNQLTEDSQVPIALKNQFFQKTLRDASACMQVVNDVSDLVPHINGEPNKKFLADWKDGTINYVIETALNFIPDFEQNWYHLIGTDLSDDKAAELCDLLATYKTNKGKSVIEICLDKAKKASSMFKHFIDKLPEPKKSRQLKKFKKAKADLINFHANKLTYNKYTRYFENAYGIKV